MCNGKDNKNTLDVELDQSCALSRLTQLALSGMPKSSPATYSTVLLFCMTQSPSFELSVSAYTLLIFEKVLHALLVFRCTR